MISDLDAFDYWGEFKVSTLSETRIFKAEGKWRDVQARAIISTRKSQSNLSEIKNSLSE